jgi:hypothetical protein
VVRADHLRTGGTQTQTQRAYSGAAWQAEDLDERRLSGAQDGGDTYENSAYVAARPDVAARTSRVLPEEERASTGKPMSWTS